MMRKRLLIGLLTMGMVLQSVSVPVLAAPADAAVAEVESGEMEDDKSGGAVEGKPDGTDEGTEEKPEGAGESKPGEGTEEKPGGMDESKPGESTEEEPDRTGGTTPGESTGEESDESGEGETDDVAEEPDESGEMPEEEPESISANQLSVLEEGQEELLTEYAGGGLYQEGSFDVVVEQSEQAGSLIAPMADAAGIAEAEEYIYQQLLAKKASIDVSEYQIPKSEIGAIVFGVINDHPDLYFTRGGFQYSYNPSNNTVTLISPEYISDLDDAAFQSGLNSALASVDSGMTDLEKAIALHDYLAVNCEYDYENYLSGSIPQTSFSAYGVLVNRTAVCQGYALAYMLLLNKVGIKSYMVTSDAMNHAWNLIELDGKYYQVDVTWDDPTRDRIGRVSHAYMFCSDTAFGNHHDWQVTSGSEKVEYTAVDTSYDSAFWKDSNSPLVIQGNDCYYIYSSNLNIRKASLANVTNHGTTVVNIAQWYTWDGTGYWRGTYSGLFCVDNRLYYNDSAKIYSIALDGTDKRIEFTANTAIGYIYGSAFCQGKVLYCLHQSPELTEKETVLTAHLSGGVGEPDIPVPGENEGALNLDNFSAEYTTTDGEKINSAANGRPKLLIFYSNGCGNSKNTIRDISRNIGDYAGADVYAIETNKGTRESVEEFKKNYGCSAIAFSYDTGDGNSASMWKYVYAAGLGSPVSWPVICYIDANNRLQYVTSGYQASAEVLSNLKKYCNAVVEVPQIYKITYILNGGTNSDLNPSIYTSETDTIVLENATRDGHRFAGWYRDSTCTVKVTRIEQGSKGNITLYAKWSSVSSTDLPEIDMTPASGNVVMGFSGTYYTETADKILKRLNEIRLEACKEGVLNPRTGESLTEADYVPLEWSSDLEAIARLRAAEATVNQDHTRPNGQSCFTVKTTNGEQSWAENLAWNNSGLMAGIEQWYSEKNDWVKQTGKVTGHYTSIINPYYQQVAVGAFRLSSGGWYSVAQEFSYKNTLDEQKNADHDSCVQYMEVQGNKVTKLAYGADKTSFLQVGDSCRLPVTVTVQYKDYYGSAKNFTGPYQIGGSWSSSDEKAAVVDDMGNVTALGKGTAQISITAGTKSVSTQITVYGKDESAIVVKSPNVTTYKVGQKINLTGGKVTYPSGSQTKTVTLTAGMVSGFDSTNPGICVVQVTTAGYTTSFDTLIVEEPKLTATTGQRLSEVVLPQNEYGTYTWQDNSAIMEKTGIYTFTAEFTPKDETKFQKLKDIQVQVTAQETLGTDTDVTFKTNRFIYNGTEQEPKVVVRASDTVLTEGQDYTLSYSNNRNVGIATVIIDGVGCYLGSISKTFEIKPAQLVITAHDKAILIGDPIPISNEYQYEVSGLMADDVLITEPAVSCGIVSSTEAGRYDIVLSGADAGDNYNISYVNGSLAVASEYVSCTVTFDVQGHGHETAPADYFGVRVGETIDRPDDPSETGYRFDGWYRDAACTKVWNFESDIVQSDMTLYAKWLGGSVGGEFTFQEIADVYYTGNACKPAVSVYDGDILLKSGRDYQIKYYNNTNANKDGVQKQGNGEGIYFNEELPYVEIIGKGNYTDRIKDGNKDTVKVNFNILRASIGDGTEKAAAGVTLKVSEQLVTAKKVQKPFSSIKYVKGMKRDKDFRLRLTVENARDQSGKSLAKDLELDKAEIPAGYEGEFLLTVEGIGNYEGTVQKTIWVTDKAHLMKNATITLGKNLKSIEFKGEAVELIPAEENSPDTFTVKYGKTFLKPVRDYTVSYLDKSNERVGKATLVITGTGEYVGTKTVTFNIKGKAFSAKTVQVSGIDNKVYTGRALTQNDAVLTYSTKDEAEKTLQYGTDYTITYAKNINKGSATMTFKGVEQEGYSGSFKKTFKITAADIADMEQVSRAAAMSNMVFPYCKAGVKPVEEILLTNKEGFVLCNGKDYTLKYKNNKAVAEVSAEKPPTVTVQGKGNYAGKFDVTFQITKSGLKHAVDNGNIEIRTTAVAYNPKKAETYEYKPAVKLMDGKSALRGNVDYEIQYLNNTQADYEKYLQAFEEAAKSESTHPDEIPSLQEMRPRAVITAKAESNYVADGEIVVQLPIYQTKLVKKNLQIDVAEAVYTGSQLKPAVTVRDTVSGTTLSEGKDYTVSYGANNKSGKNKGSVTITGIAPEYGGSVTVKFEVVRKPIAY